MGILISGLVVITMLLVASGVMFSSFLETSVTGAQSLKDLTRVSTERLGSALNIASGVFDGQPGRDLSVLVDNTGSQTVVRFGEMDVIVEYTDSSDNAVRSFLDYQASEIADNKWTVPATGVTPDSFNPGLWDSDESLFIDMRVNPAVKSGTFALVVVATPWGGGRIKLLSQLHELSRLIWGGVTGWASKGGPHHSTRCQPNHNHGQRRNRQEDGWWDPGRLPGAARGPIGRGEERAVPAPRPRCLEQ